jgi:hypothetical protein
MRNLLFGIGVLCVAGLSCPSQVQAGGADVLLVSLMQQADRAVTTVKCRELEELLVGSHQVLNVETIQSGFPVHANAVKTRKRCIRADYEGAQIDTWFRGHGFLTQWVTFSDATRSVSKSWSVVDIGGESFLVHEHQGFRVYTRPDLQFVMSETVSVPAASAASTTQPTNPEQVTQATETL